MENLKITITISSNGLEIKSSNINVDDYLKTKELHDISIVDEITLELIKSIKN
jgi:hypothetical protein